jgi:Fur family ferric uptake transcriptional regulator
MQKGDCVIPKPRPEPEAFETFRRFLETRRLRLTRDRRAIVAEVFATHDHFSMDDLFIALRLKGERLSKTTLYRNLPLLVECGLIRRVSDDSPNGRFEHVLGHPHHDHFICLACGREIEFASNAIERAQDEVCRQHGFEPVRHRLGIWGYCRACGRRGGKRRAKTEKMEARL